MLQPFLMKDKIEAGCDEAGRGCLAGPVFGAAVIFPKDYYNREINDSKKLSEKQRLKLRNEIFENAISWKIGMIDNVEIDTINILNASIKSIHIAISKLEVTPELLLIDGNRFHKYENIPFQCIIKGDEKFLNIAAASILAKTFRDEYIIEAHQKYPEYNWKQNKGYATKEHREAILKYGRCPLHRFSFILKEEQLKLDLL